MSQTEEEEIGLTCDICRTKYSKHDLVSACDCIRKTMKYAEQTVASPESPHYFSLCLTNLANLIRQYKRLQRSGAADNITTFDDDANIIQQYKSLQRENSKKKEEEEEEEEEEEAYASITESQKRVWLEDEAYTSIFDIHGIAAEIEDARKKKEKAYAAIGSDWTESHYKIAQESAKKFETHTANQDKKK